MISWPNINKDNQIDLIIANGENAAGGAGITAKTATEILGSGVNAITLGDHVWDQMNFNREIDQLDRVCRPANFLLLILVGIDSLFLLIINGLVCSPYWVEPLWDQKSVVLSKRQVAWSKK